MNRRVVSAVAAGSLVVAGLTGCAGADHAGGSTTLTVFAAASLKEPFSVIEKEFERAHPSIDVVVNYAGSQDLVAQMDAGAPADVFASANEATMRAAEGKGLVAGRPSVFATNTLTIAVAKGNPEGVASLADLASRPDLVTVRCAPAVPCGELTDAVVKKAHLSITFDTEQNSVKDTVQFVAAGEADAALVYRTDVQAQKDALESVDIPEAQALRAPYELAETSHHPDDASAQGARAFVDFVNGAQGQQALTDAGFGRGEH